MTTKPTEVVETPRTFPAQCSCGHIFLEKYEWKEPQNGMFGFCWCGFCRTRLNLFINGRMVEVKTEAPTPPTGLRANARVLAVKGDELLASLLEQAADYIVSLEAQLQAVTAERDELREYARHKAHCALLDYMDERSDKCTCGLEQLLRPEAG